MPSELLDTLLTTDDRELLRTELELLKSAIFKVKKDSFAEVLKCDVRASVAEIIEREMRSQSKEAEAYLNELLGQLDQLPILEVTIAFQPTQTNLEHIANQASTLLEQSVILQVSIQPEIIGGAMMVWNGHYHDASLKTKLDATIEKVIHENL